MSNDEQIEALNHRRNQAARIIEQAATNAGLHSEAVVTQARTELNAIDGQLADLHAANSAHTQAMVQQTLGYRFDRPPTDSDKKAIAKAQAELDKVKKEAADAIASVSQELSEKASELDKVMQKHGQFPRFPVWQSAALELMRLAESAFHVRG